MFPSSRAAGRCLVAFALTAGLAACQGAGLAGGSPAGKPVALDSIEGAPPAVQNALNSELAEAATSRKVELVGVGQDARYRVKGYLTAARSPGGEAQLAYVWDVFDAKTNRHSRRVAGSSQLPAKGRNPWDGLDKEALRRLAARSMEEIAAFLAAPDAPATAMTSASEEPTG